MKSKTQKNAMPLGVLLSTGITIAVLIIVLVVSQLIIAGIQEDDSMLTSTTVTNESLVIVNGTAKTMGHSLVTSITALGNATQDIDIAGNVSYSTNADYSEITVTYLTKGATRFGGTYNVTYVYGDRTHAYNTTIEGSDGLFELSDWLPLIALVIAAAVIVGIVMTYMGGSIRRE